MRDGNLDRESAGCCTQLFDIVHSERRGILKRREQGGPCISGCGRTRDPPEAGLSDKWTRLRTSFGAHPPGRRVVQIAAAVMADAHAMRELTLETLLTRRVFDDPRAFPDTDQPAQRSEFGGEVSGQLKHRPGRTDQTCRSRSALAAEQVPQHRTGDEGDRQARKTEQADEEEFERDEIHVFHSTPETQVGISAASAKPAETTPSRSRAPRTLAAVRKMKPAVR